MHDFLFVSKMRRCEHCRALNTLMEDVLFILEARGHSRAESPELTQRSNNL